MFVNISLANGTSEYLQKVKHMPLALPISTKHQKQNTFDENFLVQKRNLDENYNDNDFCREKGIKYETFNDRLNENQLKKKAERPKVRT